MREKRLPIVSMDVSSKKCKKRGKRTSSNKKKFKKNRKIDLFSNLPDYLLHQILSHLHPKDAARTCSLSKKWKQIWTSYNVLTFDVRHFGYRKKSLKKHYKNVMDRLLSKDEDEIFCIQKFSLCFTNDTGLTVSHIKDLIAAAIGRNVRELEIQLLSEAFSLPSCVMSGSSITALHLYNCILPSSFINLPRLQNLSLKNMTISPFMLQILINGCPVIEDLRLIQCAGLKTLFIGPLDRLRRVDIHKCRLLGEIIIEAPGLETFWYYSDKKRLCKMTLSACIGLKELTLDYPRMTDNIFHDQVMGFQKLEKLVLSSCNGLKRIRLFGNNLRKLVIRRCRNLKEVEIDAPNLTSIEFHGQRMPFLFRTRPSLKEVLLASSSKAPCNWDIWGGEAFLLHKFLDYIDHDKGLKSMSLNQQDIVIYEDVRAMLLPLRHITKPHSIRISPCFQDLLDTALKESSWSPNLSIMSHCSSDFPEIIYKELNKGKTKPECCGCFGNKCWRHYLKNISTENWIFESSEWSKDSACKWQKTTLTLDWKY
ncbi:unnamed protein product [Amaranthus hypochondriacus]